ncbi:MAG: DUF3782 domain-containing protein [Microcystaceae cyanobacterium]
MANTAEDVWQLLAELVAAQKATDLQLQATDRQLHLLGQQVHQEISENNQQISALRREVKSTNQAGKMMSQELGNLGGKWGRFVENMVAPACETIFLKRGIPVHQVSQRVKKRLDGQLLEIDILVTNENHVLVVEVKSSLSVTDVKDLVADLQQFRYFFPEYAQKQLYGAVAGIEIEEGADKYAYRQGFFVLAQAGETVAILNNDTFQPKNW